MIFEIGTKVVYKVPNRYSTGVWTVHSEYINETYSEYPYPEGTLYVAKGTAIYVASPLELRAATKLDRVL